MAALAALRLTTPAIYSLLPLPSIERDGDTFVVSFDRTDLFETRERFEELAESRYDVEVIRGDREWTTMRIASDDPRL